MTLDMLSLSQGLKDESGPCLNGNELFQHFSDPLQLLLNGGQKLICVSVRSFLDQFQFQLFILESLEIPDLLFCSGDGKSVFVQEFLDFQDEVQVFPPVEPL